MSRPKVGCVIRTNILSFLVKLCVSGLLIYLVFSKVDLKQTLQQMRQISPAAAGLVIALLFFQVLVAALRWKEIVLSAATGTYRLPTSKLYFYYYLGNFLNQGLPSTLGGDALRAWQLHRDGVTLKESVFSVVSDRLMALTAISLLILAALPFWPVRVAPLQRDLVLLLALGGLFSVPLTWLCCYVLRRLQQWLQHRHWQRWLKIAALQDYLQRLFAHRGRLAVILSLSFAIHLLTCLMFYLLLVSLDSSVNLIHVLLMSFPVVLFAYLPISVAGWGIREVAMFTAFQYLGVSESASVAVSILFGFLVVVASLPAGVLWLLQGRREAVKARTELDQEGF